MEKRINVAELLKDCPKGMELYSPLCGKCIFDRLNMGTIICKKQNTQEITFTNEGYYMLPIFEDCECLLFPSKENRDWSKFQRPLKDGDIIVDALGGIHIMQNSTTSYCYLDRLGILDKTKTTCVRVERFATEEEKQKLFDSIKDNGYERDPEQKSMERIKEIIKELGFKEGRKDFYYKLVTTDSIVVFYFAEDEVTIKFRAQCGVPGEEQINVEESWKLNKIDARKDAIKCMIKGCILKLVKDVHNKYLFDK